MDENKLIEVKHLKKYFDTGKNSKLKAVDDISFEIRRGETLGLVGESGCGKSTTGKLLIKLLQPTGGEILYGGRNIFEMDRKEQKEFTKRVQMIFQDPYASLNPRMTVGDAVAEGIDIHNLYTGSEREEKIHELLHLVGLNAEHANRFPHEFSGGQRQRVGIARALSIEPRFIICDEPISALDVSIQAQVINLLIRLQNELNLTYLFIAHDLSMVKHISDRIAVMYLGTLVEVAASNELYQNPWHPYTQALLSAVPVANPRKERVRQRILLEGDVPSPINPAPGCRFKTRCRYASEKCNVMPELKEAAPGHYVACHLV